MHKKLTPSHAGISLQRRYEVARQNQTRGDNVCVVGLGRALARSDAEGGDPVALTPTADQTCRAQVAAPWSLALHKLHKWRLTHRGPNVHRDFPRAQLKQY